MSRMLALTAALAWLAFGLPHLAQAQTQPQVSFRAVADSRPDVLVWIDTPDGNTRTDPNVQAFQDTFASTNWLFLDNGVLLVRRGDTTLVASAHYHALDSQNTFWALHNRREYTLDGSADRDPNDPTQGGATIYVTVPGDQGDFITARVEVRLTFQ